MIGLFEITQLCADYLYSIDMFDNIYGGVLSVMVTVVANEIGDPSFNSGQCCV